MSVAQHGSVQAVMDKVLAIRYTDLELEKKLCTELLETADRLGDHYAYTFSHTYLGDYHLALAHYDTCGQHLKTALQAAQEYQYEDLLLRIHSLMGLNCAMQVDEQNALQHYVTGLSFAHRLKDISAESLLLNNIAFIFYGHQSYELARQYYEDAYALIRHLPEEEAPHFLMILGNLVEIHIVLGLFEKALVYMELCENLDWEPEAKKVFLCQNWCGYYAGVGDIPNTLLWAERIIDLQDAIGSNMLSAFETYLNLCNNMCKLGIEQYARIFFTNMEQTCNSQALNQQRQLEDARIQLCLQFDPEESHPAAYYRYYTNSCKLNVLVNRHIASGMKSQLQLSQIYLQNSSLQAQQAALTIEANEDELTGLYNRRYLEERFEKAKHTQTPLPLGIIMIDIDCLKEYNDYYGHPAGDALLAAVGGILRTNSPAGLSACRFGGDEFICFCENVESGVLDSYIQTIREDLFRLNIPHAKSAVSSCATLSIGSANGVVPTEITAHDLQHLADTALYQSKQRGRNTSTRLPVN